jgi:hypothetical protein
VSSVGAGVSGAVGRLLARPRRSRDGEGYVFCAEDGFWFRPAYTDGRCPLCGEVAPAPPLPLLLRSDRSWLGLAFLALESLGMLALVLLMYFKG